MSATLRYILITAARDRLVVALFAALLVTVAGSMFVASSAVAEQNAFGLAFAGEGARLVVMLGLITFISFHIRRLHESREIEAILARPISRASFVLACFIAYTALAITLALMTGVLLGAAFTPNFMGLLEWAVSLVLEVTIVVSLGLFCAMVLESPTSAVVATLGLYVLARTIAGMRFIVENHTGELQSRIASIAVEWFVEIVAVVMPRLDLFGQTRWLVYGPGGGWGVPTLLMQTAVFVPLLLAATIRDLHVKRF